jgi:hypothetical protein
MAGAAMPRETVTEESVMDGTAATIARRRQFMSGRTVATATRLRRWYMAQGSA